MQAPPTDRWVETGADATIADQQAFWNSWNGIFVDRQRGAPSLRQAEVVEGWLFSLQRRALSIVDVGCGTGWTCRRLSQFGSVVGIDLSHQVLQAARERIPDVRFIAGDFMQMALPPRSTDVIVALEVLAHVADQRAFLRRISQLLQPGGYLMLATQNRFVLERSADVAPRARGQVRQWVDRHQLRALLQHDFDVRQIISVHPHGHRGILRLINSPKLNRLMSSVITADRLNRIKERFWLGHTLMALAQVRR